MKKNKKVSLFFPILIGVTTACIAFFAMNFFGQKYLTAKVEDIKSEQKIISEKMATNIEYAINEKLFLTKSVAGFVQYDTNLSAKNFYDFASEIHRIVNGEIQSVQLVKDSIIIYNFPTSGNEQTLGKNILQLFEDRALVQESIDQKAPMIIGPRKLIQGTVGMVFREPIIIEGENKNILWGYAAMVINLDQLVDNNINVPIQKLSIYSENPSMFKEGFFIGDSSILRQAYLMETIHLPKDHWSLYLNIEDIMQKEKHKANLIFWSTLLISVIIGLFSMKVIFDVQRLVKLNRLLKEKNERISHQLEEKILFINEIHHRIKNHFQMIKSLNSFMHGETKSKEVQEVIDRINRRVQTLSQAYDQFDALQKAKNFMPDYINTLVSSLLHGVEPKVLTNISVDKINLSSKLSVIIGVILNELLINSFKHAFSGIADPSISIQFKLVNGNYILRYSDNGKGLPENYLDLSDTSTGVKLITLFTAQLEGSIIRFDEDNWEVIEIRFPKN
jgi:two-component sensor histidine kinase/sensor domain CHASE-containing protein